MVLKVGRAFFSIFCIFIQLYIPHWKGKSKLSFQIELKPRSTPNHSLTSGDLANISPLFIYTWKSNCLYHIVQQRQVQDDLFKDVYFPYNPLSFSVICALYLVVTCNTMTRADGQEQTRQNETKSSLSDLSCYHAIIA